jgi:hypothetical protein
MKRLVNGALSFTIDETDRGVGPGKPAGTQAEAKEETAGKVESKPLPVGSGRSGWTRTPALDRRTGFKIVEAQVRCGQ